MIGRFLLVWLAVAVPLLAATLALSLLLFYHLDLRYTAYYELLVVPLLQAAVVYWVVRPRSDGGGRRLVQALRDPLVAALLVADLLLLAAAWGSSPGSLWDPMRSWGVPRLAVSALALAAGGLLLHRAMAPGRDLAGRLAPVLLALLLAGLAADPFLEWQAWLISRAGVFLPIFLPGLVLLVLTLVLLSRVVRPMASLCLGGATLMGGAGLVAFLISHVYALNLYQPFIDAPVLRFLQGGLSLSLALLVAGLLYCTRRHAAEESG